MKSLKTLRLIAIVSIASFGLAFAADEKKDAPASKKAGCCARAAKESKACTHGECCVDAAKAGNNCEKCGGSGPVAAPEAKSAGNCGNKCVDANGAATAQATK